jgi:uncharacterized membrane protein
MESLLHDAARHVALALQAIAIIVVAVGSARVLVEVGRLALVAGGDEARGRAAWLGYARWLVAGLTFQLAADIVSTSFAPSWDDVGRLAAVAAIRTFLSYFLDHEMESSRKLQRVSPPSDKRVERVARGD